MKFVQIKRRKGGTIYGFPLLLTLKKIHILFHCPHKYCEHAAKGFKFPAERMIVKILIDVTVSG